MFGEQEELTMARLLQSTRIRLLTLPRQAKQASMILYDALSYWVSAIVSFWIVFGTTEFSTGHVIAKKHRALAIAA